MSSSGLNVIALISGGKDSLYSILHCIRNGHRVVALANLHPPLPDDASLQDQQEDDMDSFMYQTVGHNIIPLYEKALGIPLYRAPILGDAVDTSRIYRNDFSIFEEDETAGKAAAEDETESLIPLLTRIKQDIPHANAVSAGAIQSTYQRTRIEDVAGRLGLVPLAWLWWYTDLPRPENFETGGLLEDMAAAGCEARIIKAASGGLHKRSLWENVSDEKGLGRRRLEKAMGRFAVGSLEPMVLGEGGEYETLALDGPGFLWKQRIVVENEDREARTGEGGVYYSVIKKAKCVPKDEGTGQGNVKPEDIRRPARLDRDFQKALEMVKGGEVMEESDDRQSTCQPLPAISEHTALDETALTFLNTTAPEAGSDAVAQMRGIAAKIQGEFAPGGIRTENIVFTTILLRSMNDFVPVNNIYASLFSKPNPPARVTVACGECLPDGVHIVVSITIDLNPRKLRECLHVQSRSYWAPANIGPYSQAITVPCESHIPVEAYGGLVFVAGQIPLDPASMEIPRIPNGTWHEEFSLHATLSLQNLWRIGWATDVFWWLGGIAFLARDTQQRIRAKAQLVHKLWQELNGPRKENEKEEEEEEEEEEADQDVWDIKHGLSEESRKARSILPLPKLKHVHCLRESDSKKTPLFAVEVEALPRESVVEWQALGTTCNCVTLMQHVATEDDKIWCTKVTSSRTVYYTMEFAKGTDDENLDERMDAFVSEVECDYNKSHITIYLASGVPMSRKAQIIPCRSIWGEGGREMAAVMTIRKSW